jgi:predicted DNA-binding protein (MmcQ/YjbR family)
MHDAIQPGYTQDKKHWVDGTIPMSLIKEMIDDSYIWLYYR